MPMYPLAWPSLILPKRVRFLESVAVGVVRSPFTYQTQVQKHGGESWGLEVDLPNLTKEDADVFNAWLASLRGQYGTFTFGDPDGAIPRGTALGDPVVDGANQLGDTIATTGWSVSQTGALLQGDWIQIGTRLHKVLADVDSDGSGDASIEIFPSLLRSPTNGSSIIVRNTMGLWRLASNVQSGWEVDLSKIYNISFQAYEALS